MFGHQPWQATRSWSTVNDGRMGNRASHASPQISPIVGIWATVSLAYASIRDHSMTGKARNLRYAWISATEESLPHSQLEDTVKIGSPWGSKCHVAVQTQATCHVSWHQNLPHGIPTDNPNQFYTERRARMCLDILLTAALGGFNSEVNMLFESDQF
jgi:hypothetical protein